MLRVLDVVALRVDLPECGLQAGARGTVLELLDAGTVLVEFADGSGAAVAVVPVAVALLQKE